MGVLFWKEPKASLRLTRIWYKSGRSYGACGWNLQPNGSLTANVASLIGGVLALLADTLNAACVDFSVKARRGIRNSNWSFASLAHTRLG